MSLSYCTTPVGHTVQISQYFGKMIVIFQIWHIWMQGIVIELMTARFLFYSNSSKSNEKLFGKRSESKCKWGYVRGHGMLMNCTMGIGRSLQSSINPWRIISNNQLINEPKPIISVYTEIWEASVANNSCSYSISHIHLCQSSISSSLLKLDLQLVEFEKFSLLFHDIFFHLM